MAIDLWFWLLIIVNDYWLFVLAINYLKVQFLEFTVWVLGLNF
jgi:hypothetical protein